MQIIDRDEWGARSPRSRDAVAWSQRTGFAVHHSAGPKNQAVTTIQNFHMDTRRWSDIGYNFLVRSNGNIYEGRGWTVQGAHASGHNIETIGVCVIGDYRTEEPSAAVKTALAWLYQEANRRKGARLDVRTHRQLGSTDCPGDRLHRWTIANLAGHKPGTAPKPSTPKPGRPAPGPRYDWPLPAGHYFGPRTGGYASVSGFYDREFSGRTDNEWIRLWVAQLQKRGWNARKGGTYLRKYGNDGLYGDELEALIRAFQRDQGLSVDGLLGPITWRAAFTNPVTA